MGNVLSEIRDVREVGATPWRLVSAADVNETLVKDDAGIITSIIATNANAAARYLKLYDSATEPVAGTDTPVHVVMLPPSAGVAITFTTPLAFAEGIGLALTTGAADADTGAVAAEEILVNLGYA